MLFEKLCFLFQIDFEKVQVKVTGKLLCLKKELHTLNAQLKFITRSVIHALLGEQ